MPWSRRTLTVLLLVFAVFTVGFAVGKEVGVRRALVGRSASPESAPAAIAAPESAAPRHALQAWYFHSTKRCVACNTIEAFAKEALETRFASRMADGSITWQVANMDDVWNEDAVRRYGLIRSSLVLVETEDGAEKDYSVPQRVWDLTGDKEAFFDYVQAEVEMFTDLWPGEGNAAEDEEE